MSAAAQPGTYLNDVADAHLPGPGAERPGWSPARASRTDAPGTGYPGEPHRDAAAEVVAFGAFRLFPRQRRLERGGETVALSSRALDILIALVEQAGEVIDKRTLMARAWRDTVVDESNLRVHVAGLRRLLDDGDGGARYVTNVPGRGYCFVGQLTREHAASPVAPPTPRAFSDADGQGMRLPPVLARMVGRDDAVRLLSSTLMTHRFVTIVGPGGIGKTTVAVAVAHALAARFGDAICFLDFGALADGDVAVRTLVQAVERVARRDATPDPLWPLAGEDRAGHRLTLLVLDNCEHVIAPVATLAEHLIGEAADIHILCTSREALRVRGEQVYRLPALDSPPPDPGLTAEAARTFPAVQLFLEHAAANGNHLELVDRDALCVAGICARLDGIPLAIELAARRVGAFGIDGTASLLDSRFRLQWRGRRTALARHQTLRALLDWSYDLLPDLERKVFHRLSRLAGAFALGVALEAVAEEGCARAQAVAALDSLVAKSLLSVSHVNDGSIRYRFPETTRVYAMQKQAEADALSACAPQAV